MGEWFGGSLDVDPRDDHRWVGSAVGGRTQVAPHRPVGVTADLEPDGVELDGLAEAGTLAVRDRPAPGVCGVGRPVPGGGVEGGHVPGGAVGG